MPKVFLIRVGMDSVYGGFVSPIFSDNKFVFLPIPEEAREGGASSRGLKTYSELETNPSNLPLTDFLPKDKMEVPKVVNGKKVKGKESLDKPPTRKVHNDPEFVTKTYGGNKGKMDASGRILDPKGKRVYDSIRDFSEGDFIAFYAAFLEVDSAFKYRDHDLSFLQEKQKNKLQYNVFAFLKLKYPPIDRFNYRKYEDDISNNVHYLRGDFETDDISYILKGDDESGWIKPIRMDDGHPNLGPNYQMNEDFAKFKLKNKDKKGLNRCYCSLHKGIVPLLLESKL